MSDKRLTRIIEQISRQEAGGKPWRLSADDMQQTLGLAPKAFYRKIYAAQIDRNPLISLSTATCTFSQDSIREFVSTLELFCGKATVPALERAGLYFSHPEQVEILSTFLSTAVETLGRHRFQAEIFSAMLQTFKSYRRARETYLQEYFSLDEIRKIAAIRYCSSKEFDLPDLAHRNAEELICFFFRKHILETDSIFASLGEQFHRIAVAEGYADPPEDRERFHREVRPKDPDPEARVMGLDQANLTLVQLKSRYKHLMKRYHPDINPEGLARCQEINAAYAVLMARLTA